MTGVQTCALPILLAWTANDPTTVRRLEAAGVDGIVSDDPEMTLATLLGP